MSQALFEAPETEQGTGRPKGKKSRLHEANRERRQARYQRMV